MEEEWEGMWEGCRGRLDEGSDVKRAGEKEESMEYKGGKEGAVLHVHR